MVSVASSLSTPGADQDFKLGGAHLKKLRRAEGGAKIFGVFRVKNHDFTPKNHIFPILGGGGGGGARYFLGISCEKSRFYAKKNHIFTNFRGGARRVRPPPESATAHSIKEQDIGGLMVSVVASSAVDRGFESRSGKTKDYNIGICWFFTKE